jgi:hypothetical protein
MSGEFLSQTKHGIASARAIGLGGPLPSGHRGKVLSEALDRAKDRDVLVRGDRRKRDHAAVRSRQRLRVPPRGGGADCWQCARSSRRGPAPSAP